MIRSGLRALVLLAAVAPCACKGGGGGAGAGGAADAGAPLTGSSLSPEEAAKVLVRIGDKAITLGEFAAALEHMDQFDRMRYQSPERRKELLNEMINVELMADEAREKGYDQDPRTQQEIRAVLRDALLKEARKTAPKPQDIAPEEVQAYYDAHRADYRDPERRRVSVVALPTAPAANAVLDQAKKGLTAAQWGELVRSKSVEPAAKAAGPNAPVDLAGDLGIVSPPGDARGANPRVPEEVRAAVFQIEKVGDVLPSVVQGADGRFYVVRLTAKTDPVERTREDADRSIRVKLSQDKLRAAEDALLAQLRTKYPVQIDDNALATVRVDLPDPGSDAGAADAARAP
jgi:DNA-directed RNA polymerase subunit F